MSIPLTRRATVVALACAAVGGCGGSSSNASRSTVSTATTSTAAPNVALLGLCTQALTGYTTLGKDMTMIVAAPAQTAVYGPAVADAATLKTTLVELRAHADPSQQVQLDQYSTVLDQLGMGFQTAAGGNFSAATGQITGVAQQIGRIPVLVNQICGL